MKKIIILLLAFTLVFSSIPSFAAGGMEDTGNIIHTGIKRIYRAGTNDITIDLINDVTNNIDNPDFLKQYYKEVMINGVTKYINVIKEEEAHLKYLGSLGVNPTDLADYVEKNKEKVGAGLEKASTEIAQTFDEIPDKNKGNIQDYKGNTNAILLKTPDNYSTPVQGLGDHTTRIMKLTRPSGISATKWIYKVEDAPRIVSQNEVIDGTSYNAGEDIPISEGKYLLLCATDATNKVKAYANIKITTAMIKAPRIPIEVDNSITADFKASENKSGATVISGLPEGSWKISALDAPVDAVYEDSKFAKAVDYSTGLELVLANDDELTNFKKDVIIYSVVNGKINRYKIFSVDAISGILPAIKLEEDIELVKGSQPDTTSVKVLPELKNSATKWMYALVDKNTIVPSRDRVYKDSMAYENNIKANVGDYFMLLATDDADRVRAYTIIEVTKDNLRGSLADALEEFVNYAQPEKGSMDGTTKFAYLKYEGAKLYYKLSDSPITVPDKYDDFSDGTPITPDGTGAADHIKIFDSADSKLKDENGFVKYMMVYAVDDNNKVIAATRENFIMNTSNVKLPDAAPLPEDNYKEGTEDPLKSGESPNSTVLKKLNKNGIPKASELKYVYTFVDNAAFVPGINEVTRSTRPLEAGKDLSPARAGENLLILLVDNGNRTKYYATIPLTPDNTRISNAKDLLLGMNYSTPEPGSVFGSTRFNLLGLEGIKDATQFRIVVSNTAFKATELDSKVEDAVLYATIADKNITYVANADKTDINGNILGVDTRNNRYLLLLATDDEGKVKGAKSFALAESMVRGNEAKKLTAINYTLDKGMKPGTIRFTKLSPFGIGNTSWMYKWAATDVFSANPPFENQIVTDATSIRTKTLDQNSVEALDDIKVGPTPNYGYILLLATNGNRVVGYDVIEVKESQSTANILNIHLEKGSNPDSTRITGDDVNLTKKYVISTTTMDSPGPLSDLPNTGVKDVPQLKEITLRIGEHLRIFNVDNNNKIIGFKDFKIVAEDILQGKATLRVLKSDGSIDDSEILEGRIKANAVKLQIELTDADWADVIDNKTIKDAFINGFKADGSEQGEWSKVMQKVKDGKFSISKSDKTLTITTSATEDYNITKEQKITLTIPPMAIEGAINPISADGNIVIKPTIDARISGSIIGNIRQSAINSGSATIYVDIVDGKWASDIETKKQTLLDGFIGEGNQWSQLVSSIGLANVKLVDPQRISITIPKNTVKIDSPETVTLTIPQALVEGSDSDITASPAFTIYPDILPISAVADGKVILESPKYINALKDKDLWTITLDERISFKDDFSATKDLTISTLPSGLKLEISKVNNKELSFKLTGKTSKELINGAINVVIHASAINEKNYSNSNAIPLPYEQGDKLDLNNVTYEIGENGILLKIKDSSLQSSDLMFSTDSTTGTNGTWKPILSNIVNDKLVPTTIYVRETKQPDNFKLIGKLVNPPAPTGIVIDKYIYANDKITVTLNEYSNLEYSLGVLDDWKAIPSSKTIELKKDSTLTVRKSLLPGDGEEGLLPSLATPKLNGLYLGDVKLNVSQSKIMGATRDMRYKLSDDGTWNTIGTNDPVVDFREGNRVWISEAKNDKNERFLGIVSQASMGDSEITLVKRLLTNESDSDGIYYHIGDKKMVNKTGINLQYNITKGQVPAGNWFNLTDTANNVNFIPGNVFVRKVEDANSLPSTPVKIFEIADPVDPPKIEVNEDSKELNYDDGIGGYKLLDDSFEYKINTGEYQNGTLLKTDPRRLGNVTVYVKRKATKTLLPSKEISFKFIENISLANVRVNVAEGIIDGTTTKIEYRTDVDSPWKIASATKTPINMYKGMNIWIREAGKTSTEIQLVKNLEQMADPTTDALEYSIAQKYIKNKFSNILEYRMNDGNWNTINVGQTLTVNFVPTKLSVRTKATVDQLASNVVDVINNLAYPEVAPVVVADDNENKVRSINVSADWTNYEFKLKTDSEWIPASLLTTYDLSGDKIIHIRKKGNASKLPSEIAEVIFTKNIYLDIVELRQATPLRLLNTEPEMEYQVYLKDKPIPTTWIKATTGTTNLDAAIQFDNISVLVIRDSRNIHTQKVLKGSESDLPIDLSKVSYEITASEVVFTGITNRMKYKLSSPAEWTDGNDSNVGTGQLEVIEIIIEDRLYPSITRTIAVNQRVATPVVTASKVEYIGNKSSITLDGFDKDKMEYSIDDGRSWIVGTNNTVEVGKDDILVVRAKVVSGKANEGNLPSLPTKQLNGTSLVDVKADIQGKKLLNTTKAMQYSLDSTDGKNGTWKQANDNETVGVQLDLGTVVYIRETANIANIRKIGPIGQEPLPILNRVYYNIVAGKIANFTEQNLEYRVSGGTWKPVSEALGDGSKVAYNVDFKPGSLEIRLSANGSNAASKPATLVIIKSYPSKPQMDYDDIEDKVILPIGETFINYEYRIIVDGNSSPWASAENLIEEDLSGKKDIEIRKKATKLELHSEIQKISFTDNLIKRVGLSTHVKPFELNGTTINMMYNIYLNDGRETGWILCSNGNTAMPDWLEEAIKNDTVEKIEVREKDKPKNLVIIYKK